MSLLSDVYNSDTLETVRAQIVGYMKAAGLIVTNLIEGSVPHQIIESMTNAGYNFDVLASQQVRGRASLDTSCDPGDYDPFDATNEDATPARGYLSEFGAGVYGTERLTESFATGRMTINNGSISAIRFAPERLTFQRNTPFDGSALAPTYRNQADPTVYTNPDGTVTIGAGGTLDVTVVAEQQGILSNAPTPNTVALVSSLGTGVSATNAGQIVASAREPAEAYRARCRVAAALLSLAGPADAYKVIALAAEKDAGGNIFFLPPFGSDGSTKIGIDADGIVQSFPNAIGVSLGVNRVYVDSDKADGTTDVWFADASGDPGAQVLTDLTALFDAIYWPENITRSFNRVVEVPVTVDGTVKAKSIAGTTKDVVVAAIADELGAAFPLLDIGGYDQTDGAGTLYLEEIASTVNGAYSSIYKVTLSSPSGDVALAKGEVAVLTNNITSSDVTLT